MTPDLEVMSLSSSLGIEITSKENLYKKIKIKRHILSNSSQKLFWGMGSHKGNEMHLLMVQYSKWFQFRS